jgi:hypothetical protein
MPRLVKINDCNECPHCSCDADCYLENRVIYRKDVDKTNFPTWCPLKKVD